MSEESAPAIEALLDTAKKCLAIQDVFLQEGKSSIRKDFNQTASPLMFDAQSKHGVDSEALIQERQTAEGKRLTIVRYFADLGFRVTPPKQEAADQTEDQPVIAEIEARFCADYLVKSDEKPSADVLGAFAVNVMYHVWPYWREYLQSSLVRLRLPPVTVPMFSVQQMQEIAENQKQSQTPSK